MPMYLADIFFRERKAWDVDEGEFGEVSDRNQACSTKSTSSRWGDGIANPSKCKSERLHATAKGPNRNFIDVGYGVSQALPILTELFRKDSAKTFLLQQPEVHLHPSAQAALGTLFCQLASQGRQLLVETHSDSPNRPHPHGRARRDHQAKARQRVHRSTSSAATSMFTSTR